MWDIYDKRLERLLILFITPKLFKFNFVLFKWFFSQALYLQSQSSTDEWTKTSSYERKEIKKKENPQHIIIIPSATSYHIYTLLYTYVYTVPVYICIQNGLNKQTNKQKRKKEKMKNMRERRWLSIVDSRHTESKVFFPAPPSEAFFVQNVFILFFFDFFLKWKKERKFW